MYTLIIIKKILLFFSLSIRMSKNSIKFDGQKIKRDDFYKNRKIFNMNDIDANKILISKKQKYGNYDSFQHFIGYNDNNVIKPVYLELPQMTGYINKLKHNNNVF